MQKINASGDGGLLPAAECRSATPYSYRRRHLFGKYRLRACGSDRGRIDEAGGFKFHSGANARASRSILSFI
jgi:hypothetical protein